MSWTVHELPGILCTVGDGEMVDMWVRLGRLIRRAREAADENAAEFAERARISAKTLLRVENGLPVRTRSLVAIDRGFGWPPGTTEDILAGADLPATPIKPERPKTRAELEIEASAVLTRRQKDALIRTLHELQAERDRETGDQAGRPA